MFSTFSQATLLQKNKIKAVHVTIFFVPFNPMAICDCPTPWDSHETRSDIGTRKAEVLNSLIINTTAKPNDTTDILQTFR